MRWRGRAGGWGGAVRTSQWEPATRRIAPTPVVCVHGLPQMAHAVEASTPGLRKLRAVLLVLEARLADIVRMWEMGQLAKAGLSRAEVERLVCALFEDTDFRAQCLQRIRVAVL